MMLSSTETFTVERFVKVGRNVLRNLLSNGFFLVFFLPTDSEWGLGGGMVGELLRQFMEVYPSESVMELIIIAVLFASAIARLWATS